MTGAGLRPLPMSITRGIMLDFCGVITGPGKPVKSG